MLTVCKPTPAACRALPVQKICFFAEKMQKSKQYRNFKTAQKQFFRPLGTSPRVFSRKIESFALVYVDFRATATHFVTILIFCKKCVAKKIIFCKKRVAKNIIFLGLKNRRGSIFLVKNNFMGIFFDENPHDSPRGPPWLPPMARKAIEVTRS